MKLNPIEMEISFQFWFNTNLYRFMLIFIKMFLGISNDFKALKQCTKNNNLCNIWYLNVYRNRTIYIYIYITYLFKWTITFAQNNNELSTTIICYTPFWKMNILRQPHHKHQKTKYDDLEKYKNHQTSKRHTHVILL